MTSAPPPRRRPSARVYRRRRAVVLIGLLLVIVAVVLLIWRPWSGSGAAPVASPTPTETPLPTIYPSTTAVGTPVPDASATEAAGPAACTPATVNLTAVTNASSYAADAIPQLSLSMTNTGAADCVLNAGTSQQVFTITSGSDTIWTSTDCQSESSDLEILLTAGQTVNGAAIPWDRTRSSPDTCAGGREAVAAGGAAYNLSVSVGSISSTATTQFLLN